MAAALSDPLADLRRRLDIRLADIRLERTGPEGDWRQLTRLLLPERGRYLVKLAAGKARATSPAILDPTATIAHGRLAAFLMAGITNPALPWFKLGLPDDDVSEDDEVRAYLAECERRMYRVLAAGTFYPALHQAYEEIAAFGTAAVIAMPDYEDVLRFHPLTVGEYFVALDDNQNVDELLREYELNVSQLVRQFGRQNCSMTVQRLFDQQRYDARFIVCHALVPNRDRKPGRMGWEGKRYLSVYFERGESGFVNKIEGFDQKPFVVPRWHALAGDAYGIGPGHRALPDIKSLQAGVRQMREAGEKMVNPPMQGDARYMNAYQGQLPGDINWIQGLDANPHAGIRPLFQMPPNISALAQEVEGYRGSIKETFYTDMILAISQMEGVQPRNEMEISERRTEKMLMLGPMLERWYGEALSPLVRLTFSRMQAVGIMPRPPAQLHGRQIEPQFINVLAQAQRAVGTTGIEQLLRLAGSMAGVWPMVAQKINPDEVVELYGESLDVPDKIIVPQRQVDAARAQAAREQAAQQQAAQAQQLAQGAQTLSQTNVGGGTNALAAMLGRQGGVP